METPFVSLRAYVIAVALAAACGGALCSIALMWHLQNASAGALAGQASIDSPLSASCNVLALQIHGDVVESRSEIPATDFIATGDGLGTLATPNYTVASDATYYLQAAADESNIKAVILDVDSGGGDSAAGEEIARVVKALGKPVVAVIHGMGASTAYLIAAASDKIYALSGSSVGSIGATSSFLNTYQKDQKDGLVYEQLSSGPYKDTFSPDKPLTDGERTLIMRDVNILRDNFVKTVAVYRHKPIDSIAALADGSTMLGEQALQNGLIDEIGTSADADRFIENKIGEPLQKCWE